MWLAGSRGCGRGGSGGVVGLLAYSELRRTGSTTESLGALAGDTDWRERMSYYVGAYS